MLSSIFSNSFLSAAFFLTISIFFYSRVEFSNPTIVASIYSSNPDEVMAKLMTVTLT
jgi:hypothetical protein